MSCHFCQNVILTTLLIIFCAAGGSSQDSTRNISDKQDIDDLCHDSISSVPQVVPDEGKDYGKRARWGASNYIKAAQMLVNSPIGYDPGGDRYRHSMEMLFEAHKRFGPVPEICMQLAEKYRYLGKVDSAIMCYKLAEQACLDTSINEIYRFPCFEDSLFLPRIRYSLRDCQEYLEWQKARETVTVDSVNSPK